MAAQQAFFAPSALHAQAGDALPKNDFLKEVLREKNRADRYKVPLSLVLFQLGDHKAQNARNGDQLLQVLHDMMRETDILGHVEEDSIAVLCPHTDDQGVQAFMRKIGLQAAHLPYSAVCATYPDDLFDNLSKGTCTPAAAELFMLAREVDEKNDGYPFKRGLDIAGALVALCLLGPLMLLVAAAIAWTSPGSVIFRQTRLGRGGLPFTFYKFRSMELNVDDGIHREFVASLINSDQSESAAAQSRQALYKLQCDPRVTRMGKVMRKTSIDELPQLFNVLRGDMSLVGPRPPIPYETSHYQSWHLRRILSIKPGITGLWQVDGRSRVSFNEMVRMDLRYIRHCSLWTDIQILLKTIRVVIGCKGAV